MAEISSGALSWNQAWLLVRELLLDPTTHTFAAVAGWSHVPDPQERAAVWLFEAYVNTKRSRGQIPIKVDRPWLKRRRGLDVPPSPERRKESLERRARLMARLGMDTSDTDNPGPE